MDENKKLIMVGVISAIVGAILAMVAFAIYDIVDKDKNDTTKITEKDTNNDNNSLKNVITTNGDNYDITLNEGKINIASAVSNDTKSHNVNISGIKLNNKDVSVKIENITSNSNCANTNPIKNLSILINGNSAYQTVGEGCYLLKINDVVVLNNSYLAFYLTSAEGSGFIYVYDSTGKEVYNRVALSFDANNLEFTTYDEKDEFYISKYKLVSNNSTVKDELINKTNEHYCDRINEYGYCN